VTRVGRLRRPTAPLAKTRKHNERCRHSLVRTGAWHAGICLPILPPAGTAHV